MSVRGRSQSFFPSFFRIVVDLVNNPGFAYFCFILRAIIEKQENQDYSSKKQSVSPQEL